MCNKPQPLFCTLQYVPGCHCPSGTVLDELQNKCVKADECSKNTFSHVATIVKWLVLFFTAPCPPVCSHEFCSKKRNRKKPCSRYINNGIASLAYNQFVFNRPPPHSTSGCPNQCHSTYCNACYYSETPRSPSKRCKKRVCPNELVKAECLKRWAKCVGKRDRQYNKVSI